MKLRQKIFELFSLEEEKFNLKSEEGDLILVINGHTTNIKLEDLFIGKLKRLKNGIKGFSILQNHKIEDGFLIDGDNNKYSLYFNEKNILFKEIIEPTFQAVDIKLSEDEENKYLDILIDGIKQSKKQEKDEQVESVKSTFAKASVDKKPSSVPKVEVEAKEIELEDIIEELEEQGYDHFGKGQYNIFLQHNKKPVLYIGKEKAEYIDTNYNDGDKANVIFIFNDQEVVIGIEDNALIFPITTNNESANNESKDTDTREEIEVKAIDDEGESVGSNNEEIEVEAIDNNGENEEENKDS